MSKPFQPATWALAALAAALYLPTAEWLLHRWSLGVWYHTHGFLVFPIAIWLAHGRLKAAPGAPPAASAWGFAFLVPAVLLQAVDALLGFQILSALSLILAIPGLCLLLLGRERTKSIWFPLAFLAFAVPIPLMIVSKIHLVLRHVAAWLTEAALGGLGYDLAREGTALRVGPESLQIADACSGFSTLMALLMIATLVAYTARMPLWRRGLLVALVFPVAAFCNALRCIGLCMVVAADGKAVLDTMVHPLSGFITFALALGLLHLVERLLTPREPSA